MTKAKKIVRCPNLSLRFTIPVIALLGLVMSPSFSASAPLDPAPVDPAVDASTNHGTVVEKTEASVSKASSARQAVGKNKKAAKAHGTVDPKTESAAMLLVDRHLPQLLPILENLRRDHPSAYRKAILGLARSSRRLEIFQKRGRDIFEAELRLLKLRTKADLLTAQLKVRDSAQDREDLRATIADHHNAEVARLRLEVQMSEIRVTKAKQAFDKVNQRLASKLKNPESLLNQAFESSLRKAGRRVASPNEPTDDATKDTE